MHDYLMLAADEAGPRASSVCAISMSSTHAALKVSLTRQLGELG
jgi:hypothetical protein